MQRRELVYQSYLNALSAFNIIIELILPTITTFFSISLFITFAKLPLSPKHIVIILVFYLIIYEYNNFY